MLVNGEPAIGTSIDISRKAESILSALERSIAVTVARNNAQLEAIRSSEREIVERGVETESVTAPIEELEAHPPILRASLQLIVNAIFYLEAMPNDVEEDWESAAPRELVEQLSAEKAGTRKTAENTLTANGYIKVKYVGRYYARTYEAQQFVAAGSQKTTHFRRGHFTRQPYGPKSSLRKKIFIAPMVINATRAGESPGRVYEGA